MVELFTQAKFVGFIRNHLEELSSNKMKMNLNSHFYGLSIRLSIFRKHWAMANKKIYLPGIQQMRVVWCKISEQFCETPHISRCHQNVLLYNIT